MLKHAENNEMEINRTTVIFKTNMNKNVLYAIALIDQWIDKIHMQIHLYIYWWNFPPKLIALMCCCFVLFCSVQLQKQKCVCVCAATMFRAFVSSAVKTLENGSDTKIRDNSTSLQIFFIFKEVFLSVVIN